MLDRIGRQAVGAGQLTNASTLAADIGVEVCLQRTGLLMAGSAFVCCTNLAYPRQLRGLLTSRPNRPLRLAAHAGVRDSRNLSSGSGSGSDGSDSGHSGFKRSSGRLRKKDYRKFVHFFRQASPYIEGHRDKTFVVVIPGEV